MAETAKKYSVHKPGSIANVLEPYAYVLPALCLFSVFVFFPFAKTLYLSLNTTDAKGVVSSFVGFGNFITILTSPQFLNSLWVSAKYAVMVVVFSISAGFIAAILSHEKMPVGSSLFKTLYALPMAISSASASIIFMFIFHPSIGILNYILNADIGWLTTQEWALFSVVIVTVWMNMGLNFIFMLAALQSVPHDLYECAALEGVGFFKKHLMITLPCVSPTLFFLVFINTINSFQSFAQINLMTSGGPGGSTSVIVFQIYQEAFANGRFGMACAQSVILFIILFTLTMLQFRFEKKVTY